MSDTLESVKYIVREMGFADFVRNKLAGVRWVSESDLETLDRMLFLARKVTCMACNGRGHTFVQDICRTCDGSGERSYMVPKKDK